MTQSRRVQWDVGTSVREGYPSRNKKTKSLFKETSPVICSCSVVHLKHGLQSWRQSSHFTTVKWQHDSRELCIKEVRGERWEERGCLMLSMSHCTSFGLLPLSLFMSGIYFSLFKYISFCLHNYSRALMSLNGGIEQLI